MVSAISFDSTGKAPYALAGMRPALRKLFYVVSILIGAAGFALIPFLVGVDRLLASIAQAGWMGVGLFILLSTMPLVVPAFAWWMLMRADGIPCGLWTALKANFMGFPLNFITPSMYLGGEPLKTVYIAAECRVTKRRVLATIILGKFQELGGLVLAMIVATAMFFVHNPATGRNAILLIGTMTVLTLFFGLVLYAFAGRLRPTVRILTFLARFRGIRRRVLRLRRFAEEMEDLIHAAITKRVRVFVLAQVVTLLSAASVFIRPMIFFRFIPGASVGFDHLCIIFLLVNLVNGLTPIPGGLGVHEGVMAGYTSEAGLGSQNGLALQLVGRIADVTLIVWGLWLIVHAGLAAVARQREAALTPEDEAGLPTRKILVGGNGESSPENPAVKAGQ